MQITSYKGMSSWCNEVIIFVAINSTCIKCGDTALHIWLSSIQGLLLGGGGELWTHHCSTGWTRWLAWYSCAPQWHAHHSPQPKVAHTYTQEKKEVYCWPDINRLKSRVVSHPRSSNFQCTHRGTKQRQHASVQEQFIQQYKDCFQGVVRAPKFAVIVYHSSYSPMATSAGGLSSRWMAVPSVVLTVSTSKAWEV